MSEFTAGGQCAGLIREVTTVQELIESLVKGVQEVYKKLPGFNGSNSKGSKLN